MKPYFLLTLSVLTFSLSLHGQAKYSNEFLTLGVGGRAHGMGGAVTASVSDLSASYWNPAGMTSMTSVAQFHGMHAEWFAVLKLQPAETAVPGWAAIAAVAPQTSQRTRPEQPTGHP